MTFSHKTCFNASGNQSTLLGKVLKKTLFAVNAIYTL